MGILDAPSVTTAIADSRYTRQGYGNVGTRTMMGAMLTLNNSTASTYQVTMEVAQQFDAVRLILANHVQNISPYTIVAAVSTPTSAADLNNSSGTWANLNVGSNQGNWPWRISPAANSSQRPAFTVTDWFPIRSAARTDGGINPLVSLRVYAGATAALPAYGYGTDSYSNWATRTDGRIWSARQMSGNGISTPSSFTSTTEQGASPIIGIQYLARGRVITIAGVGDSITAGRGDTYLNDSFVAQAAASLSVPSVTAVEVANLGWPGQVGGLFHQRAIDLLQSELRPDILVFPSGSPNDDPTTITSTDVNEFARQRAQVLAACAEARVVPVLWTWLPTNTAVRPYGAADALRVADNATVIATPGLLTADTATAISGITSGGQVQMSTTYTTDGIHPNDAGQTLLKGILAPVLKQALGAVTPGKSRIGPAFADVPIFTLVNTPLTVTQPGIYVWASSSAAAWTLNAAQGVDYPAFPGLPVWYFKVRDTAGPLTLTAGTSLKFLVSGASSNTLTVQPGQSVMIINDGGFLEPLWGEAIPPTVVTKSSAYTAVASDNTILVTGTTTITLPTAATFPGKQYTVKNTGTNAVTVATTSSQTIDGATTFVMATKYQSLTVVSDGSNWNII
jgi:lysophospholipase L1-like esterase